MSSRAPARRAGPQACAVPPAPPDRSPGRSRAHRLRLATTLTSALVLALTGATWGLYRDVTAGITTTDVIAEGGTDGAQDILLVGVDSRTDAKGNPLAPDVLRQLGPVGGPADVQNSDTIILVHVPEDGGAAVAFSIPRDAYVDIPGMYPDKINAAYPVTQAVTAERLVAEGVADRARVDAESAKAGRAALIGAVEGLTGVTVDHYAEVNLLGFYNLTRAVGGVDVCLKAPVADPLSGARFPAGPRTISGADALAFVRQRHGLPGGDLSRIRRQQVFLEAVADKVLARGTLTDPAKLSALVDVAQQSVVLDEGWDLLAFAQQASGIAAGSIEFVTIPTGGVTTNQRGSVVQIDPHQVRTFVTGRTAAQEEAGKQAREGTDDARKPTAAPLDVEAHRYVVHVRNGSGANGLAAGMLDQLVGLGFLRGTVDNTAATPTSVVRHSDADVAADAVAVRFGDMAVEQNTTVPSGHLEVVLGADAPGLVPATPPPSERSSTETGVPCVD
ncbi:MAG: cell envelope-related transcriptional attenuator [Pseudonocardia sp.]|nr:cell envelope-related transcriptional attenuator [Pseudonocardia sp.]